MTYAHREALINQYITAYNAFDVAGMTAHLADTVTFEHLSNGIVTVTIQGREAFAQQALQAAPYFKSRQQTIRQMHHAEEATTVMIAYTAVLARPLPNGLPAGSVLDVSGTSVFMFADGRIVKLTDSD